MWHGVPKLVMYELGNVSDVLVVNYCITHLQIINGLY
ncbi:hypothetical protein J2Y38_004545 [Flavobacterium sp. 2755]|nr:hypothetical protein [Flavobacterium sp. 2755]